MFSKGLIKAAKTGNIDKINKLLKPKLFGLIKTNIEVRDKNDYSPLSMAAEKGNKEIVNVLIENGAKLNDYFRQDPLLLAAKEGHEDIVSLLLEKGAYFKVKDEIGHFKTTALGIAAANGHKKIVELLIKKKGVYDLIEPVGSSDFKVLYNSFSPLYEAIENGHEDIAITLINNEIAVDCGTLPDIPLMHALSLCYKYKYKELIILLIKKSAKIKNIKNYGEKFLFYAVIYGDEEIVSLLINKFVANITVLNKVINVKGETLTDIAKIRGHENIVKLLQKNLESNLRKFTNLDLDNDKEIHELLIQLCNAYAANDKLTITNLEPFAAEIGKKLNSRGGLKEMQRIFKKLGSRPGTRTLEMHWNGIGEWRG